MMPISKKLHPGSWPNKPPLGLIRGFKSCVVILFMFMPYFYFVFVCMMLLLSFISPFFGYFSPQFATMIFHMKNKNS